MKSVSVVLALCVALLMSSACSKRTENSYKDAVSNALEQADLKGLSVTEDRDKNTVTLTGTLHSEDSKNRAGQVAEAAAPGRIVANEISVEPVGNESDAKKIESNVDDAIQKNYKAALIANGLNKQRIRFDSNNGVITLKGKVKNSEDRKKAEEVAASVPNVAQVVNELQVSR